MSEHGKKYREAEKLVDRDKKYSIEEAIGLLKKTNMTKFDASCEVHMRLGLDPTKADQMVRGTTTLPHGTGKTLRVVAFVSDDKAKEAKTAGATEAGAEDLIEKVAKGWMDFDIAVATPDMMKSLGKIAKTLGQKGLMPNPKSGTVTPEPAKIIKELMTGKIEYRLDKQAIVHNIFGKVSFDESHLKENLQTFVKAIMEAKPGGSKGTYVRSASVSTTMGPGISLDVTMLGR